LKENIVLNKSYKFALHAVELYRKLAEESREYVSSKNPLNDGTNTGAHIESAQETGNWQIVPLSIATLIGVSKQPSPQLVDNFQLSVDNRRRIRQSTNSTLPERKEVVCLNQTVLVVDSSPGPAPAQPA
jgi:hypothetical protein